MSAEFDLIKEYFTRPTPQADLGVGDDAALLRVPSDKQLVVSVDMSVVGTHFYADCDPEAIGWKSLAVNLSDMAAMGALPRWATLALALPEVDETWLAAFARGFFACAEAFNTDIVGGDTTRGPLNITVQIMGQVTTGQALRRNGAHVGDDVWVSGQLGSAAMGLAHLQSKVSLPSQLQTTCLQALHYPQPRVALGLALVGVAHSCIDISDGLLADLGHILQASNLGACLTLNDIPCLPFFHSQLDEESVRRAVLAGGDDYELCFTAPPSQREKIKALASRLQVPLNCIGHTTQSTALLVLDAKTQPIAIHQLGYDHFV